MKESFREIRYKEKRKKILEHAAKLFDRKGYEKASLDEIAAKLKLSKASLYHYVKSKEEILYLIQLQAIEEIKAGLTEVIGADITPLEKLRRALKRYIEVITRKTVIGALKQQELILPANWRSSIIKGRDELESIMHDLIKEGVSKNMLKTDDTKMALLTVLGTLNWTVRWYSPKGRLTPDEIGDFVSGFILRGLGIDSTKAVSTDETVKAESLLT